MGLAGPNISATTVNNPVDLELGPEVVGSPLCSARSAVSESIGL
jgi:hypothetical protein